MKNVIASILLILALIQSFYLYRTGERYQDSLVQGPMTDSGLHTDPEEGAAEETAGKAEAKTEDGAGEKASEAEEKTGTAETKEAGQKKDKDKNKDKKKKEKILTIAEDLEKLREALEETLSGLSGEWSLQVTYLPTGEGFDIESRSMTAASLIKLYIAGAYLEAVEKGTLEDLYNASLINMISQSDNDAANKLIILLGMDYINSFIEDHGFEDTKLNRLMLADNGLENYTSVSDCADLLKQVYDGSFVSREASERILSAMKDQSVRTKIPAGLPEGITSANKTGELSNVENDTAIVFAPGGDYIFCAMSENVAAGKAQEQIREMSKTVYEALGEAVEEKADEDKGKENKKESY